MSDEALNAHLDWLDDCAKEQMSEHEHVLGQGFNIAHTEEYVWCIKCERKWSKAEVTTIINEHAPLKREQVKIRKHLEAFTSGLLTVEQMYLIASALLAAEECE